jgi:RHS repeat-associated protein
VSSTGDVEQPIQWSSEFNDTELGLTYYNYRHYNPVDGRWLGRDKKDSATGNHIYAYVSNFPVLHGDQLGEDRYYYCYSGDIGLHGVLIIDNWKKRDANTKKEHL